MKQFLFWLNVGFAALNFLCVLLNLYVGNNWMALANALVFALCASVAVATSEWVREGGK